MAGVNLDCFSSPPDSISKALSKLCMEESLSDVHFVFPEEPCQVKVPSHKLILAIRSNVFRAMFFGSLKETGPEVRIVDISCSTFSLMLKYIYTDFVPLDDDNVIPLLHAAQKYELVTLLKECEGYLDGAICVKNVCAIINHASFFGMEELVRDCLAFIELNAEDVFNDETFLCLSQENFATLLKSERIGTSEIQIFNAAVRWAEEQCKKMDMNVDGTNLRTVLGDLLYQIRFNLLSLDDFANEVVPTEILTDEVVLQYYKFFTQRSFELDSIKHFVKTSRVDYPPLDVSLHVLAQIPTFSFLQAGGGHKPPGIIGERGVQSLEVISFYTTLPVRIRQLDFVPTPQGTPDHPKIGHDPCGGFRLNQAYVHIDDVSNDEIVPLFNGKIPLGQKTSLKFVFPLRMSEWTKLSIGVTKICQHCGIVVAPDYSKIPEQYTRNRHGNSIKSPNTRTIAAFGNSFQIATSGCNIIKSIKFEKGLSEASTSSSECNTASSESAA